MLVLFKLTPVTATVGFFTVTLHVAVFDPSFVVTVIVALPAATPFTVPFASTVATFVLLLFHVTSWFVALLGATVAVNVVVFPFVILVLVLFKLTPVTATVGDEMLNL